MLLWKFIPGFLFLAVVCAGVSFWAWEVIRFRRLGARFLLRCPPFPPVSEKSAPELRELRDEIRSSKLYQDQLLLSGSTRKR